MVIKAKEDNGSLGPDTVMCQERSIESGNIVGMDIEVESWHREGVKLLDFAVSRRIESPAELELAADDLAVFARLKSAMTERRQLYTRPLNNRIKAIDEMFQELIEPIEEADKITREKMRDCRAQQRG